MKDYLHIGLKFVSYNRYAVIAALLVGVVLLVTLGCQPRAVSPYTSQRATENQIVAQANEYRAAATTQAAAVQAELDKLAMEVEQEGRRIQAEYDAQVAALGSAAQARRLELETKAKGLNIDLAARVAALRTQATAKAEATEAALADIQQQRDTIAQIISTVAGVAQTAAPAYGNLVSTVVGVSGLLLAGGLLADNRRKSSVINGLKAIGNNSTT